MCNRRTPLVVFAILIGIQIGGCREEVAWPVVLNAVNSEYPDVRTVTSDSLAAWIESDSARQPILLDTRLPEEYEVSHLKGALRIDPDTEDFSSLAHLDRDVPIVTYCSVGFRSSDVAAKLEDEGFTNVSNLEGSIFRWANEGRAVYRDGRAVREVHPFDRVWGRLLDAELHAREPGDG